MFNVTADSVQTQGTERAERTSSIKLNTGSSNEKDLIDFLSLFNKEVTKLNLKEKDKDLVCDLCCELVKNATSFCRSLMKEENGYTIFDAVDVTTRIVCSSLSATNSKYKRDKVIQEDEFYIAPHSKAIGTHWDMVRLKNRNITVPKLIQSQFQYVSIIETLQSLFKDEEFYNMFLSYNDNNKDHDCYSGKYSGFCCGDVYKSNDEFFRTNKNIEIIVATDDFEICAPLQSKANLYKVCPIYFSIGNVPVKYQSKSKNIYVTSLCIADDLKTKSTDFNDLWQLVFNELDYLENVGINVKGNINIRATLAYLVSDNLGLSISQGFSGSYSATFYCRFCTCSKSECQYLTKRMSSKRRTKENYEAQLAVIAESEKVDLKETFGIKRHCLLSNLKYYHIIENQTVDIMHDINEGVIPFMLKNLILYCLSQKILSLEEFNAKLRFYDFGYLDQSNRPSIVGLEKKNLGQNASQMMCLFRHIPFLLSEFQHHPKIKEIWTCMTSLFEIVDTVYSEEILEEDLANLDDAVDRHLSRILFFFNLPLIPKHHMMLHYSEVIRHLGPLKHMNMFRFERKHKELKSYANRPGFCFKNICKSLAVKHQQSMSLKGHSYKDEFSNGKTTEADKVIMDEFPTILSKNIKIYLTDWFTCNNLKYRKDLCIMHELALFEILQIVIIDQKFFFICLQLDCVEFNSFYNSIKIMRNETNTRALISFESVKMKTSFEKKNIDGETYIMSENLLLRTFTEK